MSRISRRLLMRGGLAAGMVAASGMVSVAAPSGTLRIALGGIAGDWHPATWQGDFMRVAGIGAVFDGLTEIAATGELVGELAQSWEVSPDARVWTFALRRGVMFHDGLPFGAEDVTATFDWLAERGAGPQGMARVTAVGAHEVRIVLDTPDPDFALHLADPRLAIHGAGREGEGAGTGLYRIEAFTPGEGASLVRVRGHFRDGRAGFFDRVELIAVQDPADRAEMLRSGAVDVAAGLDPDSAEEVRARRGLRLVTTETGHVFGHSMRLMGPGPVGDLADLDSARIAERWWFV